MRRASITEAKNHLSALLAEVRAGETVLILDRGVPVARLESIPGSGKPPEESLARLHRTGTVHPPRGMTPVREILQPPPTAGASITEALLTERRQGP